MSEYDVDGIPHFVFLDAAGRKQGQVVGRLPKEVLRSNADALVSGAALPYAKAAGACCVFACFCVFAAHAPGARRCYVGRGCTGCACARLGAGLCVGRPARAQLELRGSAASCAGCERRGAIATG